jgi:hypothetical protein
MLVREVSFQLRVLPVLVVPALVFLRAVWLPVLGRSSTSTSSVRKTGMRILLRFSVQSSRNGTFRTPCSTYRSGVLSRSSKRDYKYYVPVQRTAFDQHLSVYRASTRTCTNR